MKPIKEPIDNIRCPVCLRNYSYIRARVTLQGPKREICLSCGATQEKELSQRKQKTSEEV